MPSRKSPRKGSLQVWPRKRAKKFLPRVNWSAIPENSQPNSVKNLKGFICYKAGMASAYVKDVTEHSMTKGKKIAVPVTILECPSMKILSVRFYKNGNVVSEVLAENADKELKRKLKLPKRKTRKIENIKQEDYDDIKLLVYSQTRKTGLKKVPDISEIGLAGDIESKRNFVKEKIGKEISVSDVFQKGQIIDVRGLTKGFGYSGPVKRFGITLKAHKSEKGRRNPGSIAPWHPARVTFRAPMAGQIGMHTRVSYNSKIIGMGKSSEFPQGSALKNISNFGNIKTDHIILSGSVQGPAKRVLIATSPLRGTKKQIKKSYEFIELR